MIKFLLLFTLSFSFLNASKILSYNIYDRTDRADVMITFDTPYDGVIKQSISPSKIIIKLSKASIESSKFRKSTSKFLHYVNIIPSSNQTKIIASVPPNTKLLASKTSDAYGLRLRFVSATTINNRAKETNQQVTTSLSSLPTKKDSDMSTSYYIVVTILIIGILILFVIKKRLLIKGENAKKNSSTWLFQQNEKTTQTKATQTNSNNDTNHNQISIRFQKEINQDNSVVMLDFAEQSYLVLMGKSNILLDKFTDNKPTSQEDFESILQDRHQELDNFLNKEPQTSSSKDALQAYKERAASMIYES